MFDLRSIWSGNMRSVTVLTRLALAMFAICVVTVAAAGPARAALQIDITKGNVDPLPIAITDFLGGQDQESSAGVDIATVITNDLERSGLFRPLPKASFIEKTTDINVPPRFGDWRIINSFNVAAGKSHSQFTDCILISKDCLIVLEAKNYTGKIDAEGDFENDRWYAVKGTERLEVQSLWGDNPFHQVNEYCMSLLRMVQKRSSWNIPVYGVIVFPEGADLSLIVNQIGRFYRIATIDRLVAVLDIMEAEARRHNSFTKRPTPHQIENIIRGRAAGAA